MEIIKAINCKRVGSIDLDEALEGTKAGKGLVDDRHLIYSIDNTFDMEMYYNYMDTISELARNDGSGNLSYMLDLGYIPVIMPPLFAKDGYHRTIYKALSEHNIPFIQRAASSFTRSKYNNTENDVWVSKMDVSKILNCTPDKVTVRKLLEVIL